MDMGPIHGTNLVFNVKSVANFMKSNTIWITQKENYVNAEGDYQERNLCFALFVKKQTLNIR